MATHETHNHLQLWVCTGTGKKWPLRSTTTRGKYYNAHACRFPQENGRLYVRMAVNGGSAGSLQRSGFRENPTNFLPSLPAEYVTAFSGRTDAPEVRCDLTDTQTDRPNYSNPRCACAPRVNK